MNTIDLVRLISSHDGKKLQGVEVYGYITKQLPRPGNIKPSVVIPDNCMFVEMRLLAVNLGRYAQELKMQGYQQVDDIYMVNGSIALLIQKGIYKLPDWYSCRGIVRIGSQSGFPYVVMFDYRKNGDGNWRIDANRLSDILVENWTDGTAVKIYTEQGRDSRGFVEPKEVADLPKFYSQPYSVLPNTISTQVDAMLNHQEVPKVTSTGALKIESRSKIKPYSDLAHGLQGVCGKALKTRLEFIHSLKDEYPYLNVLNDYIIQLINAVNDNLTTKPDRDAMTGRALLRKYLGLFKASDSAYLDTTVGEYLISSFDSVRNCLLMDCNSPFTGDVENLYETAFGCPELFYAFACSCIYGKSWETFSNIYYICEEENLSFSRIINNNPYLLQSIGGLSFNDVEYIAQCLGIAGEQSIAKYRRIAVIDSYINSSDSGSTAFKTQSLKKQTLGVSLTKKQYEKCKEEGTWIKRGTSLNVKIYLNSSARRMKVDISSFTPNGYKFTKRLPSTDIDTAIQDYKAVGMGVEFSEFVTSTRLLEKELFVYNTLYELGEEETGIDSAVIDKYIDEYEEMQGFKLEKEQRDAVHLLEHRAGAVSGAAGSGKTTSADCFMFVIDKIDSKADIKFAAPTGKAAKRLQEVVKRPVKTMHSMFKIFGDNNLLLDVDENDYEESNAYFFFDEDAMVTLDLLYSCLKKISNGCIYLLGDYHQLPPIGKGLPFKNALRFLPCVFLRVSKRAAEGSNITYNSDLINNHSSNSDFKPLVNGKDFFTLCCNDDSIEEKVKMLCEHYTGVADHTTELKRQLGIAELPIVEGLTADDIQVVTPISKASYSWGATKLNTILQPVFNRERDFRKKYKFGQTDSSYTNLFIIGDRVIHVAKNLSSMQWYEPSTGRTVVKKWGYGISNGDVGRFIGVLKARNLTIEDEQGIQPEDFEYPSSIRDDETWRGEDDYFVAVQYYDFMSDSDYMILYRCTVDLDADSQTLKGDDLSLLSLFYAGTTHKMQGSQAKLIIAPLGNVTFNGFITRNMIYVGVTRASKLVFLVGSVSNEASSMLSRARRETSDRGILTIGELFDN